MIYTPMIGKAISFATEVHKTQKRKGKDIPYITHPLAVAMILARVGATDDQIVAGILHDTVEDCVPYGSVTREMVEQEFNAEIAHMVSDVTEQDAKNYILANFPYSTNIIVDTGEEALPKAIQDMKKTFSMLGNMVGAISLIVGAITIFIVIFVNAITRRKYIGIMKGIGISASAIEISYIIQSLFYALSGIAIASLLVMGFLKPWFAIHPLKFPVTEGQLSVTSSGLMIRGLILMVTAFISGYIPARMVTKQNTLDAILGR